ncbi:LURP-one-related family protein [Tissierella sp. MB52-C2]|uniref:LURP-one-related/scramblase family protein n=1 Tax=Tissierella sp. MB52-C2 TaxID=3070999 RepID=UPI00280AE598|nr:LURP-one-related family protein [Tissierella sp. MB52-C2]WMM24530.1 LURP-one-related family protein [Tissierella sp. MB52-C2]
MRYLIRERIFSFSDSFTINDENNRPYYEVVGKVFSIGNKLNLYDMNGRNLLYIEQKIFRFLPEYIIYEGNKVVARIQKEFTFFKPKFTIDSSYGDFTIDGDVFAYNFNIIKNGRPVAWISKKFLSFSDTYSIDIADEENHAFILSLVIVLDQVFHDNRNNN